jgi:hypothetical protein
MAECQITHETLFDFAPQSKALKAIEELTEALIA